MTIDTRSFRQTMGNFATGVAVITLRLPDGKCVGLTVNSLTSVSLDPPLVLFCIDRKAHLYPAFKAATSFTVNFLAAEQEAVSRHFANFRNNPAPENMWRKKGSTILNKTLGWMLCKKTVTYKGGDHDIIVGEVRKLCKRPGDGEPLLYFRGGYRHIEPQS